MRYLWSFTRRLILIIAVLVYAIGLMLCPLIGLVLWLFTGRGEVDLLTEKYDDLWCPIRDYLFID